MEFKVFGAAKKRPLSWISNSRKLKVEMRLSSHIACTVIWNNGSTTKEICTLFTRKFDSNQLLSMEVKWIEYDGIF